MYIGVVSEMIEQKITPEVMMQNFQIVVDGPECVFCEWQYLVKFIQDNCEDQTIEVSVSNLYGSPENYFHIGNPALMYVPENLRGRGYGSQIMFCAMAFARAKYTEEKSIIFILQATISSETGTSNENKLTTFLLKNGIDVSAKAPGSLRGSEVEEAPYFEVSEKLVSENPNYKYWLDYWNNTLSQESTT